MPEEVKHINIGQKYRIMIERAAVKGIDGFKVEANGDDMPQAELDAKALYSYAQGITKIEVY